LAGGSIVRQRQKKMTNAEPSTQALASSNEVLLRVNYTPLVISDFDKTKPIKLSSQPNLALNAIFEYFLTKAALI
jgi:hypothetical protein